MIIDDPTVVAALAVLVFTLLLLLLVAVVYFRIIKFPKPFKRNGNAPLVVGFFHPYCASGGGGERVLWKTIEVLAAAEEAELERPLRIVIYTIDEFRKDYKAGVCVCVCVCVNVCRKQTWTSRFFLSHNSLFLLPMNRFVETCSIQILY